MQSDQDDTFRVDRFRCCFLASHNGEPRRAREWILESVETPPPTFEEFHPADDSRYWCRRQRGYFDRTRSDWNRNDGIKRGEIVCLLPRNTTRIVRKMNPRGEYPVAMPSKFLPRIKFVPAVKQMQMFAQFTGKKRG